MKRLMLGVAILAMAAGAAFAADDADFAQRFRVGDWALYRIMGVDTYRQRHFITAIDGVGEDTVVTFAVTNIVKGKEQGKPVEFRKTIAELRADDEKNMAKVSRKEMVKVGDREIEADVVVETNGGKEFTYYGSNAIPVNGVIRMQEKGKPPTSELIDFGRGEEPGK